jgi:Vitamin K epoxide reductase family
LPLFAGLVGVGFALLARARFAGWFWALLALSQVASAAFVAWFIFQTLFRIQLLCPWCSLVWLVTVPLLFYTVAYALAEAFPHARGLRRFGRFLLRWQVAALVILYAPVVFAIVYEAFLT